MSADLEKANNHTTNHAVPAAAPVPRRRLANPATLGLFSFASTTFILSLYNASTRHITKPNAVVGMALFCGGLCQLLAGMWEFPSGNTFGATAFSSYGAFWLSYAAILIPGSGILAAYEGGNELSSALGIYLITWAMVTFFFFIASLRKPIAYPLLFGFLTVTFCCLAGGEWGQSPSSSKAGGVLGAITAMIAYYIGVADMLADEPKAVFRLPLGAF
jgi:succinate-acetate transporter protein